MFWLSQEFIGRIVGTKNFYLDENSFNQYKTPGKKKKRKFVLFLAWDIVFKGFFVCLLCLIIFCPCALPWNRSFSFLFCLIILCSCVLSWNRSFPFYFVWLFFVLVLFLGTRVFRFLSRVVTDIRITNHSCTFNFFFFFYLNFFFFIYCLLAWRE